jgi:(p)ppGpp synthase/HD superfamily hydrolase
MAQDLDFAIAFATAAHGEQKRKFTDEPYIVHPLRVAKAVKAAGGDTAQQIAAVLHDVVEDTPVTIEEVEAAFGADVAYLVACVTKRPKGEETYFEFIERSLSGGPRVHLIKRADVTDNMTGLPADQGGLKKRYAKTIAMLDKAAS